MMTLVLLLCLAVPAVATILPASMYQASSTDCMANGTVTSLSVSPGCNVVGVPPPMCTFKSGDLINVTYTFTSHTEITAAREITFMAVYIGSMHASFHFPMELRDPCLGGFKTRCPLAANVEHSYTNSFIVPDMENTIGTVYRYELHDQNDVRVTCIVIPVKIIKP